ncbi:MAG TPA: BrnT family toxin [Nevskiaceae bacterium]|nr:BrnT family toxin [Nevskiaceae bacterium]
MDGEIRHEYDGTTFVWRAAKAAANLAKHGVSFDEATTVFSDPLLRLVDASRNDEARDAVIGFDLQARLLFVVHVEIDGEAIRLISARRASRDEEDLYAQ